MCKVTRCIAPYQLGFYAIAILSPFFSANDGPFFPLSLFLSLSFAWSPIENPSFPFVDNPLVASLTPFGQHGNGDKSSGTICLLDPHGGYCKEEEKRTHVFTLLPVVRWLNSVDGNLQPSHSPLP